MNLFGKMFGKDKQPKDIQPVEQEQQLLDEVVEPVGELPVGTAQQNMERENKYMFQPIEQSNNSFEGLKFDEDDYKPTNILTADQKQYVDNGYYLASNNINPTVNLFQPQQEQSDATDGGFINQYETKEDGIISNIDGSYSSVSSQSYEEERTNEHKYFATSVEDIDNYKDRWKQDNNDKPPITGSQNIFSLPLIDEANNTTGEEELEKTKVIQFSSYNNSDNSKAA